jgi:hypothetical protein
LIVCLFWAGQMAQGWGQDDPGQEERLRWFPEAKFGMFVHWGPYSLLACGKSSAAAVDQTMPSALNSSISSLEYPRLPNISSVCAERRGGGDETFPGVFSNLAVRLKSCSSPKFWS